MNLSRQARISGIVAGLLIILLLPLGCTSSVNSNPSPSNAPVIRVRLLSGVETITLSCTVPPTVQIANGATTQLNSPRNAIFNMSLSPRGWVAGNATLGGTIGSMLLLQPGREGSVSINGVNYRGIFKLIPVGGGTKFDVINELDVDAYLASVVSKEMLAGWHPEAYKAQAIVARTYAIYEKQTAGLDRYWDVWPDTRSQVYGGIPAETTKSRDAVAATAGIVVAHPNAQGDPKIFKAYFSSCCGGISQSAADAFGDPYIDPLTDQNVHSACRASTRFNWGPIVIDKTELTKRFIAFGQKRNRPEQNMAPISRIDIQLQNRYGRPVRFLVTDTRNNRFSLSGEEFRWAVNTSAAEGTALYSSFVKIINDSDKIRFVEGHGWGHGVGMCQWCAQARAEAGLPHEDIVMAAYPTAVLVRAY